MKEEHGSHNEYERGDRQHLFWVFGHPEVYIMILPAMGIVSEVLPTFARKPLFGYPFIVYSSVAIGFLSFGVWAHHMFAAGLGPLADAVFALSSMTIAVPTGVKIFNWIATLWQGAIQYRSPMLYGVAFIFMFIIGGISGVMHASPPVDLQQTDTYFVVAHIHYVLFGGSMFALLAGLHYWFPKMSGRMLDEPLAKRSFWLVLVGANLAFFPMHFSGLRWDLPSYQSSTLGMPGGEPSTRPRKEARTRRGYRHEPIECCGRPRRHHWGRICQGPRCTRWSPRWVSCCSRPASWPPGLCRRLGSR